MQRRTLGLTASVLLAGLASLTFTHSAVASDLPGATVPEGWGVNIHFTDPAPGEMGRFQAAGFRRARMDFLWNRVEKQKGVYDFSAYDRLYYSLSRVGVVPLFILDYGNDLYQTGSPRNDESRAAFARFAAAAAKHYEGRRVIWEIWNEPNGGFWKPAANADEYAMLAIRTAHTIHATVPTATVVAPGSAGFPYDFFETCFKAGLLKEIDAVSFHPYRGSAPESAEHDYARLRELIARYAPSGKEDIPMISSEWGYSTQEGGLSEEMQAAYLSRMWLANVANGVNLSIFYDWHDDGKDPKYNEHHFGTVHNDYTPKASYLAAQSLIKSLDGYTFRHHLQGSGSNDWKLLFQKGDSGEIKLVTWNADAKAPIAEQTSVVHEVRPDDPTYNSLLKLASIRLDMPAGALVQTPASPPHLAATVHNSTAQPAKVAFRIGTPSAETVNLMGQKVSALTTAISSSIAPGKDRVETLRVPFSPLREEEYQTSISFVWNGETLPYIAAIPVRRTDPLRLSASPSGDSVTIFIENPGEYPFEGKVDLLDAGGTVKVSKAVRIAKGVRMATAEFSLPASSAFSLALKNKEDRLVAHLEKMRFVPLQPFPAAVGVESGFHQVRFVKNAPEPGVTVAAVAAPPGSPAAVALRFPFHFEPMWRYDELAPVGALAIPADATALTLQVYGDGSNDYLRCRYQDSSGQTFQPDLGRLNWKGWKLVHIPLDGSGAHWGGAGNGALNGPLNWEGLLLIDSADQKKDHSGEILIAGPTYVLRGS